MNRLLHYTSWILHGLAHDCIGIDLGESSWYPVAFVMYYALVLWPIVWRPFRSVFLGIIVAVAASGIIFLAAFWLFIYAMGIAHE